MFGRRTDTVLYLPVHETGKTGREFVTQSLAVHLLLKQNLKGISIQKTPVLSNSDWCINAFLYRTNSVIKRIVLHLLYRGK